MKGSNVHKVYVINDGEEAKVHEINGCNDLIIVNLIENQLTYAILLSKK